MIEEGEVESYGKNLGVGATFNLGGFLNRDKCTASYITKSFVSVWAITARDLEQIGRTSTNL